MPGTFVFKPIEANLTHNTDLIGKMNPYCSFVLGENRIKSQICKKGGKHPHWNDAITVPVGSNQSQLLVELMDKDKITHDDIIGACTIDLREVESIGQVSRWYPLSYKNKPAGEILMEVVFQPSNTGVGQYAGEMYHQHQHQHQDLTAAGASYTETEVITNAALPTTGVIHHEEHTIVEQKPPGHVFVEQRQVVEPHTFMKEVEVVETRSALQEIEVMEPVKVIKDVQYTQPVPVIKQIEVVEPQVVTKEIEVIEPRVVTKTIQVVENVPVMRQVEVIELRNKIQEVEVVEPQTFTKQVEVTEYVPMMKQVEVSHPVTLRKAVEFVEPIITTQTITKEIQQPVIVNEEIITSVGPASVVGVHSETREVRMSGQERLIEGKEFIASNLESHNHHHHGHKHHEHHHHLGSKHNEHPSQHIPSDY